MVVIFTHLDQIQRSNRTVEDIIKEIRRGGSDIGREFFSRSGEYVALDNRHGHQTGNEAKELIEAVERTIAANEHRHFSNRTYEEIVRRLNWYGTGTKLNMRYEFEKHPNQFATAVGSVAGIGALAMSGSMVDFASAFTGMSAVFNVANRAAP